MQYDLETQQQQFKDSHSYKKWALEIDTSSDNEEPTLHMYADDTLCVI